MPKHWSSCSISKISCYIFVNQPPIQAVLSVCPTNIQKSYKTNQNLIKSNKQEWTLLQRQFTSSHKTLPNILCLGLQNKSAYLLFIYLFILPWATASLRSLVKPPVMAWPGPEYKGPTRPQSGIWLLPHQMVSPASSISKRFRLLSQKTLEMYNYPGNPI